MARTASVKKPAATRSRIAKPKFGTIPKNVPTIKLHTFADKALYSYGREVVEQRAVPDFRDGLKPVHRFVLWAMYKIGAHHNTGYKKAARIVGDVIGKYSPHGDLATYSALVGLVGVYAKNNAGFSAKHVNLPLIEGYGNWGDFLDNAAAMRYPEARISEFADKYLLDPAYMQVMEYEPNFSDDEVQPIVLPAKLPVLLLNGSMSIAVGVSAGTPAFAFDGVLEVTRMCLLDTTSIDAKVLTKKLEPVFEYGGVCITPLKERFQFIKTGKGSLRWSPVTEFDEKTNTMYITSICPGMSTANAIAKMQEKLINVVGVKQVYDATGGGQVRYEVHLDKKLTGDALLTVREKCGTILERQESYDLGVTHRTTDGAEFSRPSYVQLLQNWCKWRIELELKVIKNQIEFDQKKLANLKLMLLAVDSLDIIVKSLRVEDSCAYLMKNLKISKDDAEYILEMKVRQLKKLERTNISAKIKEVEADLKLLTSDLKKPNLRVVKQLDAMTAKNIYF